MQLDLCEAAAQYLCAGLSGPVCHGGQMTSVLEQAAQEPGHCLVQWMLMKLLSQDLFLLSEQYDLAIYGFSLIFFFLQVFQALPIVWALNTPSVYSLENLI